MPDTSLPASRVHRSTDGEGVVLTVDGALDGSTGAALVQAVAEAVREGTSRLDIDLSGIEGFDDIGASSLLACRDAARSLDGGLHYRTCSGGAGQEVLLHAYAEDA